MSNDYGKKPIHLLCAVIILVGIGLIFHWIRKERFYPPKEHHSIHGTRYTGGWTTLAQGIVMFVGGFVLLFALG